MTDSQVPPPVDGPDAAADQSAFSQGIPSSPTASRCRPAGRRDAADGRGHR